MAQMLMLRVTLLKPPCGIVFAARSGRDGLVPPTHATDAHLSFELPVQVVGRRPDGSPNLRGPVIFGPTTGRHLGVRSGTLAGQADSCWTRAAKIPLSGISWAMVETAAATPGAVIEARIPGTARDGGPVCATVPLLAGGWRVVPPPDTASKPAHD